MDITLFIFYALSALIVVSAVSIIFTQNLLHAAFLLMITFIGVAGVFVLAGADFLAITQIMIYIGGILVLILFGVMMTKNKNNASENDKQNVSWLSLLLGSLFFVLLLTALKKVNFNAVAWISHAEEHKIFIHHSTIEALGINLLTEYILPFELAGIILLIALLGSAFIAGKVNKN
jgi:NADH:ubiquinone oxidoreductase subunit 6 (subunit J)